MSRLSLRVKTLIFAALVPVVAVVAASVVSHSQLHRFFEDAERVAMVRDVERGKALLADLEDQLELLSQDWGQWDDMYAFMADRNEEFRRGNLQPQTMRELRLHQVLLLNPDNNIVFSNCNDSHWQRLKAPPQALMSQLQPDGALLRPTPTSGIIAAAEGVLLVSSCPIVRSDKSGARRGTLIFGRFLDQPQVDHISKLGALKLRLISQSEVPQAKNYVQSPIGPMLIVAPDEDNIIGYLPLTDLAGNSALALEVVRPRELHRQAHVSAAYFTKWLLGIIGLSAVLLLLGLESLVLRRLSRASDALDGVAKSGDVTARLPQAGNDELGRLINGMNGALAAIERNVLEQRAAAREMTRLNQLVVSFLTHSPMALFVKEFPGGRYITWNPAAEQIYGVSADRVLGTDMSAVLDPEHAARIAELEQQALESGTPVSASDEIVTPEGEKRLLHVRKVPIPGASDDQAYLVGIAEDVTEFRQQQAQLQKTLQELARSNTELEQFAYVASHDLQEPLRMVASYVQLLARRYRGQLDADADDFIDFAVDGASRMQGLINDLLAYSRVGTRGKEFAPLSLDKALDTALQNLRVAVGESQAEITHDPLPEVIGDEGQLVQLLQNLVANALKFRREEAPKIHLSARHDGKQWTIGVRDNGIGIESQYLNRIFIIFQRLYTREEYAGTGIGLAICKRIVERHGGRIWVESTPGTGSTFYFTIPDDPEEN